MNTSSKCNTPGQWITKRNILRLCLLANDISLAAELGIYQSPMHNFLISSKLPSINVVKIEIFIHVCQFLNPKEQLPDYFSCGWYITYISLGAWWYFNQSRMWRWILSVIPVRGTRGMLCFHLFRLSAQTLNVGWRETFTAISTNDPYSYYQATYIIGHSLTIWVPPMSSTIGALILCPI